MSRIGGDLENLVILHEGITAHGFTLTDNPDDVGVPTADQPPPIFL